MLQNHNFYKSLLLCVNKSDNSSLMKFAKSMRYATKKDLFQILELLHISREIRAQTKTISILTAYLVLNNKQSDIIIKFNPLYDKICEILTRGLPKKTIVTLNFLTALLYTEEDNVTSRQRVLVVYAQNMIKTSGCLTAMSKLFTTGMLQQDTWQSLCRCLAETCYGYENNQNYCSHLIPLCVQRCQQGKEDLFQLVNSLLINNERNIQLFYDCGGVYMFSRQYLMYEYCLQLLNTVVSSPDINKKMLNEAEILNGLEDLRRLYGSLPHVAQWVTIIFHRLKLNTKGFTREILDYKENNTHKEFIDPHSLDSNQSDDTAKLFQNIVKEFPIFESNKNLVPNKTSHLNKIDKEAYTHLNRYCNKYIKDKKINNTITKIAYGQGENYSFSILRDNFNKSLGNLDEIKSNKNRILTKTIYNDNESRLENSFNNTECHFLNMVSNDTQDQASFLSFRPTFISTPKKIGRSKINTSRISKKQSPFNKMYKNRFNDISLKAKSIFDTKRNDKKKQRSTIGGRIFNAINESCTTIIKSVKNIFTTKNTENSLMNDSEKSKTEDFEKSSCNLVEYMRRKGHLVDVIHSDHYTYTEQMQNECNTCNDTMSLKQKLRDDVFLKDTVKKLKIGINLFGCDFKKISKTFWPDENYMTPLVLYNLYRKLIIR